MCVFVCVWHFFILKMGFLHDGQAGLELLTADDPPTLASQSDRMTGLSHLAGPLYVFLMLTYKNINVLLLVFCCISQVVMCNI